MSLLSDIKAAIIDQVLNLIKSAVSGVKDWVNARIQDTIAGLTQIYNTVKKYVTNVYKTVNEYVTNVYTTVEEYTTNVYETVEKYVTNKYYTTEEFVTNIIGASTEWVEGRLVDMTAYIDDKIGSLDPTKFLMNPVLYITEVAAALSLAEATEMVESFLAGLLEGLDEELES